MLCFSYGEFKTLRLFNPSSKEEMLTGMLAGLLPQEVESDLIGQVLLVTLIPV